MSLFFETIKVQSGKIYNIKEHNLRLNNTIESYFNTTSSIDLATIILPPNDQILYRCRVIYSSYIKDIQFLPYIVKDISSFKVIYSDILYEFKYFDRSLIDRLLLDRGYCDDILIVGSDGFVKDTSIANIAIEKNGVWFTPLTPLLKGTVREKLIKKNILHERDITIEDIKNADNFAIMNAMIDFRLVDEKLF
jgi:4-amino-4-deoxychorismate lyase